MSGPVRIWLHEGHDQEPGVEAWAPDVFGFATWAPSQAELDEKLPTKLVEHATWATEHGIPTELDGSWDIAGHMTGNEILFGPDREASTPGEIDLTIALLDATRATLLAELEEAPEEALDWDPPYRRFARWADWRSVRANLAHIANAETQYYLANIGHNPRLARARPSDDWRQFLPRHRDEATAFLRELRSSSDLCRLSARRLGPEIEEWSVRKALRRMVRHELQHWKSIRRILGEFRSRHQPG